MNTEWIRVYNEKYEQRCVERQEDIKKRIRQLFANNKGACNNFFPYGWQNEPTLATDGSWPPNNEKWISVYITLAMKVYMATLGNRQNYGNIPFLYVLLFLGFLMKRSAFFSFLSFVGNILLVSYAFIV